MHVDIEVVGIEPTMQSIEAMQAFLKSVTSLYALDALPDLEYKKIKEGFWRLSVMEDSENQGDTTPEDVVN